MKLDVKMVSTLINVMRYPSDQHIKNPHQLHSACYSSTYTNILAVWNFVSQYHRSALFEVLVVKSFSVVKNKSDVFCCDCRLVCFAGDTLFDIDQVYIISIFCYQMNIISTFFLDASGVEKRSGVKHRNRVDPKQLQRALEAVRK